MLISSQFEAFVSFQDLIANCFCKTSRKLISVMFILVDQIYEGEDTNLSLCDERIYTILECCLKKRIFYL